MAIENNVESFFKKYKEDNPNEQFAHTFVLLGKSKLASLEIEAQHGAFMCSMDFQKEFADVLSGYMQLGEMQTTDKGDNVVVFRLQYKKTTLPLVHGSFSMRRIALLAFVCMVLICLVSALYVRRDLLARATQYTTSSLASLFSGSNSTENTPK